MTEGGQGRLQRSPGSLAGLRGGQERLGVGKGSDRVEEKEARERGEKGGKECGKMNPHCEILRASLGVGISGDAGKLYVKCLFLITSKCKTYENRTRFCRFVAESRLPHFGPPCIICEM